LKGPGRRLKLWVKKKPHEVKNTFAPKIAGMVPETGSG
jgi:hypothetical protein